LKDSNAISDDPELEKSFSFFIEATSSGQSLSPELSAIILNIWANPKIKEAIRASSRFQKDSTFVEYFLDSLARVAAPGYIPTDFDIILCNSTPPPPIIEMPFSHQGPDHLPVSTLVCVRHNIGLQRKWIHLISDAEAIIFIVDLTCYDQIVYSADTEEHLVRVPSLF
jgi:guanine nucleotide-binding protein subunit alpha